jgi:hypothetical protein
MATSAAPRPDPHLRVGEGVLIDWDMMDGERFAFLLPRFLPERLFGRFTGWMPPRARRWRNRALIATLVEIFFCIASFPLGASRGGIAKLSAGLNGLLLCVAVMGAYGAASCRYVLLGMHFCLAWGIVLLFVAYFAISTAFANSGEESESMILLLVFIFFLVDVVVGVFTFLSARQFYLYEQACKLEDTAAGGEGRGIEERRRRLDDAVIARAIPAGATAPAADSEARRAEAERIARPPPAASGKKDGEAGSSPHSEGDDADDRSKLCPVCMENPKNAAFVDCGHAACYECAVAVKARFGHCFLCRKRIVSVLRIYE